MCLARRLGPDWAARDWPVETANIDGVGSFPIFGLIQNAAYRAEYKSRWHTYMRRPSKPAFFLREKGGLEVDDLWLRLAFPTDDKQGRKLASEIHRIFVSKFPPTIPTAYNIETGERVPDKDWGNFHPLDPEVANWVATVEDRWLWGMELGGTYLGFRAKN